MTVRLCYGIAMTATLRAARPVCIEDTSVRPGMMRFQPGQQCGAEIKTDAGVIVKQFFVANVMSQGANKSIGSVTFSLNTLVPVVVRIGARLSFHQACPGIFARRLIKVAVNDESSHL